MRASPKDPEKRRAQIISRQLKWDLRFLQLARHIAQWSKDPSTKCGAVIVAPNLAIVSVGFNGFPMPIKDNPLVYEKREDKLACIIHAEINAANFASRPLVGCTLYTYPFQPCSACAKDLIQRAAAQGGRLLRVVAPPLPETHKERWEQDVLLAESFFAEAGTRVDLINLKP